ncbi:hypothetical protein LINPERPRIM_LOCUS23630, partial [Linum perenne]
MQDRRKCTFQLKKFSAENSMSSAENLMHFQTEGR